MNSLPGTGTLTMMTLPGAIIFFLLVLMPLQVWAVDCSSGSIGLFTQEDVDNFQISYGGEGVGDTIAGSLSVQGDDISNIDGLADITSVGRNLNINNNPALTNIDGLSNITRSAGSYPCFKHVGQVFIGADDIGYRLVSQNSHSRTNDRDRSRLSRLMKCQ